MPLLIVGNLLCGSSAAGPAKAAEFYSWIDPAGTMVMTDDPSRIPPAEVRSPISVHHFQDVPRSDPPTASSSTPTDADREGRSSTAHRPAGSRAEGRPDAPAEQDTEQPAVLLEAPEGTERTHYLWVPLLAPVYVGGTSVSGFWCHRRVSSPVDAFKRFLAEHRIHRDRVLIGGGQLQLNNVFNGASSVRPSVGTVMGPATPVLDQVMREREQLIDRAGRPPAGPHTSPQPAAPPGRSVGKTGRHGQP